MDHKVDRRSFLNQLGVTVGAAAAATAVPGLTPALAQTAAPKGNIPDKPLKFGHMTFLTGPAAVLGDPRSRVTSWQRKKSTPKAAFSASARSRPSPPTRRPAPMPT